MKHGWTQMQVGSKGAMIRAFKPLMWLRRRPINRRLSFGGPRFHLNTSIKIRPMCCWDWADWARPLLDLHQRHSILMFQSLVSTFKTLQPHAPSEKLLRMSAGSASTTDDLSDRSRLARLGLPLWGGDQQQRSPSGERTLSPFLFAPYTSESQSHHL